MSKLVAVAFTCVALVQIATALECYGCEKDTCSKAVDTWKKQTCGASVAPYEAVCVTHTYKDKGDQKEYSVRNCVQQTKGETYKCSQNLGQEVSCKTCTTDLCNGNSASGISLSLVAILGIFLALLAPKFYS